MEGTSAKFSLLLIVAGVLAAALYVMNWKWLTLRLIPTEPGLEDRFPCLCLPESRHRHSSAPTRAKAEIGRWERAAFGDYDLGYRRFGGDGIEQTRCRSVHRGGDTEGSRAVGLPRAASVAAAVEVPTIDSERCRCRRYSYRQPLATSRNLSVVAGNALVANWKLPKPLKVRRGIILEIPGDPLEASLRFQCC